ncbi:hypothetical protein KUTeg_001905 [Tegillarca granosa]|uniref:Uncharacterized protein n=1 Tax=Tegillarca granosa TaxID=220873 RepID=A0ABQ9FST4_TEGGR|nr:hypothetical protein KUTeg_001905 [Tegillarca granosa]
MNRLIEACSQKLLYESEAAESASRKYLGTWSSVNDKNELVVETWHTDTGDKNIQFVLLSRGQIVGSDIARVSDNSSYRRALDASYAPKTKIVAFFVNRRGRNFDVVADVTSVMVDKTCKGRQLNISTDAYEYKPGDPQGMDLEVTGEPNSLVGLLAVDKAVYLLKDKHRLQTKTIMKKFGEHDTGCDNGNIRSNKDIFKSAGLAVITNANIETGGMENYGCDVIGRRRRSINLERFANHPCCVAGEYYSVNGSKNGTFRGCFEEGKAVKEETNSSNCAKAFYYCCQKFVSNTITNVDQTDIYYWHRTGGKPDVEYTFSDINTNENNAKVRSYFPESWLFQDEFLDQSGSLRTNVLLPDSITKHVIQAVGITEDDGICIAEPLEIKTMQKFFVDIDLPYSIVRMEQTEVRATIYNYLSRRLPCYVIMEDTDGICASKTSREYIRITVPPNDAEMIRFTIVPLRAGEFNITVKNEGREETKTVSFWLDPNERKQHKKGTGDLMLITQ